MTSLCRNETVGAVQRMQQLKKSQSSANRQYPHSLQDYTQRQLSIYMQYTSLQWKQTVDWDGHLGRNGPRSISQFFIFPEAFSCQDKREKRSGKKKKIPAIKRNNPHPTTPFPWINSQDYTYDVNIDRCLLNWSLETVIYQFMDKELSVSA